jgi:hypothetical protein
MMIVGGVIGGVGFWRELAYCPRTDGTKLQIQGIWPSSGYLASISHWQEKLIN